MRLRGLLAGLLCALCATGALARHGSPHAEQPYLARMYVFVDNPEIQAYVESVVQKLLATRKGGGTAPNVLIYSADAFSASTDDRGNLLVSTRALREVDSEDELAALLGHELTHLLLKHNERKSALRAFPVGVETAGWIALAADRNAGRSRPIANGGVGDFGREALFNTQAASLLWSDILTPGWNRAQEREADQGAYDMMSAAGYDPAAFGSLFSKIQAAQAQRSQRMELLKKIALAKLQQATAEKSPSSGTLSQVTTTVRNGVEKVSIDKLFDALTAVGQDYDPPAQRQKLLADYAATHGAQHRDKTPRSPRLRQNLREGRGGASLVADRAALSLLQALNGGRREEARKHSLALPVGGGEPVTPHLNFALGAWLMANGEAEASEQRAGAWLRAERPPVQAFLWRASYDWNRKAYAKVQKLLEDGAERTGSYAPFLPDLVSAAKAQGHQDEAERYAQRCREEDRKGVSAVTMLITFRGGVAPSGIYPECVRRLGHEPAQEGLGHKILSDGAHVGGAVTDKIKGFFAPGTATGSDNGNGNGNGNGAGTTTGSGSKR